MSLKLLETLIRTGVKPFGRHRELWSLSHLAEHLAPIVSADAGGGRELRLYGYGTYVPWRAKRLLSKEPETIEWIDGMGAEDVLWDVGANIGVYSLYAGLRPGLRVVAFEPVANSYFVLNRNIGLNDMHGRIDAYCLGVSDTKGTSRMYLRIPEAGSSGHALDASVNAQGDFKPSDSQAVLSYSIDDLVAEFDLPFPSHIKVDVDGLEEKIIMGARRTLANTNLKSILVEIPEITPKIEALFAEAGLRRAIEGRINKIFVRG